MSVGVEPRPELRCTYRLQLTVDFGFADVLELIPYLRDLGISHLYLSPSFQARPGSTHGYDVIDPGSLSSGLGGESGFRELAASARGAGMGIVLDVVPNHMAADDGNRYWADPVLREQFFDLDPVSGRWRRFFDIDELAGVRIEDPEVFEAMSGFVLGLVAEGLVDGLRVDHPDGLADPKEYLERLRAGGADRVWVEKILDPGERLPADWPVSGTVGYEFLNDVCGLFVDPVAERLFTTRWMTLSGDSRPFGAWAMEAKLEQAQGSFQPEVDRLARCSPGWSAEAVGLALSSLLVYRTYIEPRHSGEFLGRFQQTSPAIMAKGVEDTAFYRYARLLALNDVGGDPSRFGVAVDDFHARNGERATLHPEALLTTMTHDAKRSGDARARITALSWMPAAWVAEVDEWMALAERWRSDEGAPDAIEMYFILQTLVGVWPIEPERLDGYLEKALREAKRNSNWVEQNTAWEEGVKRFTQGLLSDPEFRASFDPFVARAAMAGRRIALAQLVLKLTSPGVPDIYQGDELEFLALVDPDNRRPVDWELRRTSLARLQGGGHLGPDGEKLWVTARVLGLRARRPEVFGPGSRYEAVEGGAAVCGFVRGGEVLTVVALRSEVTGTLAPVPGGGRWREVLSGEERSFDEPVSVSEVVGELGVAVYERV